MMKKLMLFPALLLVLAGANTARADHDSDDEACCECRNDCCDDCCEAEEVSFRRTYTSAQEVIFIEEDTRHYDPSTKPSALPNTERNMASGSFADDECFECPTDEAIHEVTYDRVIVEDVDVDVDSRPYASKPSQLRTQR